MIAWMILRFVEAAAPDRIDERSARAQRDAPRSRCAEEKLEAELGVNLVIRNSAHTRSPAEGESCAGGADAHARVDALPGSCGRTAACDGELRIVAPFASAAPSSRRSSRNFRGHRSCTWIWRCRKTRGGDPDADVVIHIGELRDSSWVAHLIARNERWVCAGRNISPPGLPTRSQAVAATRLPQRSGE